MSSGALLGSKRVLTNVAERLRGPVGAQSMYHVFICCKMRRQCIWSTIIPVLALGTSDGRVCRDSSSATVRCRNFSLSLVTCGQTWPSSFCNQDYWGLDRVGSRRGGAVVSAWPSSGQVVVKFENWWPTSAEKRGVSRISPVEVSNDA